MSKENSRPDTGATRRNLLASLASVGLAAPFFAGRKDWTRDPITLRYTSHVPRTHGLYTEAFVPFAELVEQETLGRLRLESYTDQLLHGPLDGFKAAVTGITDYTHSYITYQPGSFKLLHATQLPFIFSRPQVATLVFEELYPKYFKKEFERMGVYLAHCDCTSPYSLLSRRPIQRLEDLRGIKIRVTAGVTAEIFRELGANPVAIAAAEIYPAFQRGVFDAVALSPSDMVGYRLQEVATHFTRIDINVILLHYCLNRHSFDALPNDLRSMFYRLLRVRSQMAAQNYYSGPGHEQAMEALREANLEIVNLEGEELNRWREVVAPLKEKYVARYELEGLPARAAVADMERLATDYADLTNQQLNERVTNLPIQGIIDL